jgi:hypothetical protein
VQSKDPSCLRLIPPFVGKSKTTARFTLAVRTLLYFNSNKMKKHLDLSASSSASLRKFDY